jgi:transposase
MATEATSGRGTAHVQGYPAHRRLSRRPLHDPPQESRHRPGDRAQGRHRARRAPPVDADRRTRRLSPARTRRVDPGEHHRLGAHGPARRRLPGRVRPRQRPADALASQSQAPQTDTIDTARLQREYLNGELPRAHQPASEWRQLRRVVALRVNLVRRRTAVSNWIDRYLAHETWLEPRCRGVRSRRGRHRVRSLDVPTTDGQLLHWKLDELEQLERRIVEVEALLLDYYQRSADAQRLDAIRGLGPVGAITIVARIGPIDRFQNAEQLIAFAGLSPGVRQSDATCRGGKIGGGGTDNCLRHYLIEATVWARTIPRYQAAYQRALRRRGAKIARLVVARSLLRSIHKMLTAGVEFEPQAA